MDAFGVLGLERRLAISEEALRTAYDKGCREAHPDAGGDPGEFQTLGTAFRLLLSPGQRLSHWLELEGEAMKGAGELPEVLLSLFGNLGAVFKKADELVARREQARSRLAQSLAERDALAAVKELEEGGAAITALRSEYESRFLRFDREGAASCREEAAEAARALRFLEKWQGQLRERFVRLAG